MYPSIQIHEQNTQYDHTKKNMLYEDASFVPISSDTINSESSACNHNISSLYDLFQPFMLISLILLYPLTPYLPYLLPRMGFDLWEFELRIVGIHLSNLLPCRSAKDLDDFN